MRGADERVFGIAWSENPCRFLTIKYDEIQSLTFSDVSRKIAAEVSISFANWL
jgi:hypothetical protein